MQGVDQEILALCCGDIHFACSLFFWQLAPHFQKVRC